jgi:glycerophosphoryl diester phosphodiesterase
LFVPKALINNHVLVFGHRGVKGHAPENTLEGFRMAKDLGVDGIEFDVHMSRDGHLVVIHDDDVGRTTNGNGLVRDMTLSQLKMLDAGVKFGKEWRGAKIPTVEEVFSQIEGLKFKIEIKHGSSVYNGIEEKMVSATFLPCSVRMYFFLSTMARPSFTSAARYLDSCRSLMP